MPHDLVDTFTIEGAGHAANLEQPELFNEALFAFAERIGHLRPRDEDHPGSVPFTRDAGDDEAPRGLASALWQDDDLGPTLYEDLREGLRARGQHLALTIAGFGLILMGGALLVGAFFVAGDGGDADVAASGDSTGTPTAVDQAAGIRATPPLSPTARRTETVAAAEPASPADAADTPTSDDAAIPPGDHDGDEPGGPDPTDSADETAEPTAAPTEAPSPTPTGPWVQINGPSAAGVGEPVTFSVSESAGVVTRSWSASNGAAASHAAAFTVTFSIAGCHSVTVTALFPSGPRSSTQVVAVGVESCSGG
jgi:hypothetical protein